MEEVGCQGTVEAKLNEVVSQNAEQRIGQIFDSWISTDFDVL